MAAENAAIFPSSNLPRAFGVDEILERSLTWRPSSGRVVPDWLVKLICNQHLSERQRIRPISSRLATALRQELALQIGRVGKRLEEADVRTLHLLPALPRPCLSTIRKSAR
jgi:hypothetical protein